MTRSLESTMAPGTYENTAAPYEGTVAPVERFTTSDVEIDIDSLDSGIIRGQLDRFLAKLYKTTDEAKKEVFKEAVVECASELAATVLPRKTLEEIDVDPQLWDTPSFSHTPKRADILSLAASAEATGDPTITSAFERSIEELPEDARLLFEEALALDKDGPYLTFHDALVVVEANRSGGDLDSNQFNLTRATTFVDHGKIEKGIDLNTLDQDDALLERLVQPVASSIEGKRGTARVPLVEFNTPDNRNLTNDRARTSERPKIADTEKYKIIRDALFNTAIDTKRNDTGDLYGQDPLFGVSGLGINQEQTTSSVEEKRVA